MFSEIVFTSFYRHLDEAKKLVGELNKLKENCQSLVSVSNEQVTTQINENMTNKEKEYKRYFLEKIPLALNEKEQKKLQEERNQKVQELTYDRLTEVRDIQFKNYCQLLIELHTLSSSIQSKLIELIKLKETAHNRPVLIRFGRLTEQISNITDKDAIALFRELQNCFSYLQQTSNSMCVSMFIPFIFKPSERTDPDVANDLNRMKAKMYEETLEYNRLKDIVAHTKDTIALTSFKQFLTSNHESLKLSKKCIAELITLANEIEGAYAKSLKNAEEIIKIVETAKEENISTFGNTNLSRLEK